MSQLLPPERIMELCQPNPAVSHQLLRELYQQNRATDGPMFAGFAIFYGEYPAFLQTQVDPGLRLCQLALTWEEQQQAEQHFLTVGALQCSAYSLLRQRSAIPEAARQVIISMIQTNDPHQLSAALEIIETYR